MSEWVKIGSSGEVADGEVNNYSVGDRQVAVANVDGDLHAFDDLCTHQQCSLTEGDLEGAIIECPCHGSQFDITTGEAITGPANDPLDIFEVREQDDELQVFMDE